MLFRFGVVLPARMTEGGGSLLVAGSRPELGGWDPQRALPMKPARPTAPLPAQEPALWLAEVALPDEDASSPFWFKFLRRQGGELLWEEVKNSELPTCPLRNAGKVNLWNKNLCICPRKQNWVSFEGAKLYILCRSYGCIKRSSPHTEYRNNNRVFQSLENLQL